MVSPTFPEVGIKVRVESGATTHPPSRLTYNSSTALQFCALVTSSQYRPEDVTSSVRVVAPVLQAYCEAPAPASKVCVLVQTFTVSANAFCV